MNMVLILAVASLPLLVIMVYCLSRSVLLGWICLLTLLLYTHTFGIERYQVGFLNIDVVDICELCLIVAGVVRTIPRLRERNAARTYVLVYLCIFAFSLARGIIAHGIAHAGNDSRPLAAFLIACLYFLTAPADPESVRKYVRVFMYFGLGLVLVGLLASMGLHVGLIASARGDAFVSAGGEDRVLPADSGLAIAFCFFFSLANSQSRINSVIRKCLPGVFFLMAVYLRLRTTWVVLVVALIYILIKDRAMFRRLVPLGIVACLVVAGYSFVAATSAQSFEAKLSNSATDDRTWLWRVEGWQQLIGEQLTVTGVLFGRSLGGGYERFDFITGQYSEQVPHSEYVTQFYNMGIAGLAMVLCFMIRPLRRFWKLSRSEIQAVGPSASAWALVVIGIMIYGVTYDPTVDAYALLGIANAMVFRLDKNARRGISAPALAQVT